jgi:putative DNA primase/helicase
LTDLGNARRLVARHGHDLRYCPAWRRWYVWDGKRWASDTTGEVVRRAKETVRAIHAEAAHIVDEETYLDVVRWAMKSESRSAIAAMIDLAKSELGIPLMPDALDMNPSLLNVHNGTLDLKTGDLRPHRRQDLITKLAPVAYDPQAACPTWLAFLDRIFDHKPALIEFLQRAFGYALTGDTSEQVLFFCYGPGANGKSTLLETLRAVLGNDYSQHTPTSTLLVRTVGSAIPNDVARLKGARFVTAIGSRPDTS